MCEPISIGIAIGAATGAISSAVTGGNVLEGALMGAVMGGVTGGMGGLGGGGTLASIGQGLGATPGIFVESGWPDNIPSLVPYSIRSFLLIKPCFSNTTYKAGPP